jgi:23S rRNA (cytidine1920-2'-O)/16S rRNA (cytidine1409-2'-O)-methyltransferase
MAKTERVDVLMVQAGLAPSRSAAQRLVMAGLVRAGGEIIQKSSQKVAPEIRLTVERRPRFVSRGGEKLSAALVRFGVPVSGRVAADVGASTGGFTDCLLQNGAAKVYAVDVGKGQLEWSLRQDPRVVVMESTNARTLESLPEPVTLATVDVAFISLRLILPRVASWLAPGGDVIALVKPQFEAGRAQVGSGGVVRRPEVHRHVLEEILKVFGDLGLGPQAAMPSPLRGPKGNREFLIWGRSGADAAPSDLVEAALRDETTGP